MMGLSLFDQRRKRLFYIYFQSLLKMSFLLLSSYSLLLFMIKHIEKETKEHNGIVNHYTPYTNTTPVRLLQLTIHGQSCWFLQHRPVSTSASHMTSE